MLLSGHVWVSESICLVGTIGFEPTTPTMSRWCSNQLSYVPKWALIIQPEFESSSLIGFPSLIRTLVFLADVGLLGTQHKSAGQIMH